MNVFSLEDGRVFEMDVNSRLGAYYNQIVSVSSTKMNVQTSSYETVKRNRPRPRSCELRHDPKHSPDIPIFERPTAG